MPFRILPSWYSGTPLSLARKILLHLAAPLQIAFIVFPTYFRVIHCLICNAARHLLKVSDVIFIQANACEALTILLYFLKYLLELVRSKPFALRNFS